jgi:hypothetical protein
MAVRLRRRSSPCSALTCLHNPALPPAGRVRSVRRGAKPRARAVSGELPSEVAGLQPLGPGERRCTRFAAHSTFRWTPRSRGVQIAPTTTGGSAKESNSRQILRRSSRTAAHEVLPPNPEVWVWRRQTVTLPPRSMVCGCRGVLTLGVVLRFAEPRRGSSRVHTPPASPPAAQDQAEPYAGSPHCESTHDVNELWDDLGERVPIAVVTAETLILAITKQIHRGRPRTPGGNCRAARVTRIPRRMSADG